MKKIFLSLLILILNFTICYSQNKSTNQINLEKAIKIYDSGDKDGAKKLFLELSKKGDYNADFELFYRYINTPQENYQYLKNASLNGHEKAMKYFHEKFLYCSNSLTNTKIKDSLTIYKKYLKKKNIKEEDKKQMIDFLTKCASVPELNVNKFCKQYNINLDDENFINTPYYIWQLAEEASRGDGHFTKPDSLLTMQLILRGGNVPAEYTCAVDDYYEYYKKNEIHEFKIDNYVTSGYGINFCSSRAQEKKESEYDEKINQIKELIKKENQEIFLNTIDLHTKFVDTKIWSEEANDGSGYITWALESANKQKNELLEVINKLIQDPSVSLSDKNDDNLTLELNNLIKKRDDLLSKKDIHGPHFTITTETEKEIDSLWQKYNQSLISFVKNEFGKNAADEIKKWLYERRIENIQWVIDIYYDYNANY